MVARRVGHVTTAALHGWDELLSAPPADLSPAERHLPQLAQHRHPQDRRHHRHTRSARYRSWRAFSRTWQRSSSWIRWSSPSSRHRPK